MRHSSFAIIAGIGILVSGMTWAGPPDQMTDDENYNQSETMEEAAEPTVDTDEEMAEEKASDLVKDAKPEILTFEEAVAACKDDEDLQACVDVKTGITEEAQEAQDDELTVETPDASEDAECDPWVDGANCPEE